MKKLFLVLGIFASHFTFAQEVSVVNYSKVADIRNSTTTAQVIRTLGYYKAGDGGAAEYILDNSIKLLDDSAFVIRSKIGTYVLHQTTEVRAAQLGITAGADRTYKLNTVLKSKIHELVFDRDSILISGKVSVPHGKVLRFRNNSILAGTGTLDGGHISADLQHQVFGKILKVQNLENNNISIAWFGAKADYDAHATVFTDNAPLINKALNARRNNVNDPALTYIARVYIPAGTVQSKSYYCGSTINVSQTVELYGDHMYTSVLTFPSLTTGMIVPSSYKGSKGADVVYLHDFGLRSIQPPTGYWYDKTTARHGLFIGGNSSRIERVEVYGFQGDGFVIEGAVPFSNANNSVLTSTRSNFNYGSGYRTDGSDGNNVTFINTDATHNAIWGYKESSFLGNTYVGCHASTNGVNHKWSPAMAGHKGNKYIAKRDSRGVEPGGKPGWEHYWAPYSSGAPGLWRPWAATFSYKGGGAWFFEEAAQEGVAVGCYAEVDQNWGVNDGNNLILGGFLGQLNDGGAGSSVRGGSALSARNFAAIDAIAGIETSVRGQGYNSVTFTDNTSAINQFGFKYSKAFKGIVVDEGNTGDSYTKFISTKTNPQYVGRTTLLPYGGVLTQALFLADETGQARNLSMGTAAPTTGEYAKGDFRINIEPANKIYGWICVQPGKPGKWEVR